jgi:hypothetical protein
MWTREQSKEWIKQTCGVGWLKLIDEVYDKLPDNIEIIQVYQKYAGLKFDLNQENLEFESFLNEIEERSKHICEICGKDGFLTIVDGWEKTLCSYHFKNSQLAQA